MPYTSTANRVYKDPITTVWSNDLKNNDDALYTGTAKVWVSFDASGVGSAISHKNVSSVARNAAGTYTITFTTGFSSTNYAVFGGCRGSSTQDGFVSVEGTANAMDTGSCKVRVKNSADVITDVSQMYVAFFGAN